MEMVYIAFWYIENLIKFEKAIFEVPIIEINTLIQVPLVIRCIQVTVNTEFDKKTRKLIFYTKFAYAIMKIRR